MDQLAVKLLRGNILSPCLEIDHTKRWPSADRRCATDPLFKNLAKKIAKSVLLENHDAIFKMVEGVFENVDCVFSLLLRLEIFGFIKIQYYCFASKH